MSIGAIMSIIAKFLPELISLIKWIGGEMKKGADAAAIKKTITSIGDVYKYADKIEEWDAQQAAGELDEIFTGIELNDIKPNKLQGSRSDI